jgi:predicted nuclease of predicted toxin-antitoxin system
MRLLLDECVPRPLRRHFAGHTVRTVEQAGYKSLKNGALLAEASKDFDVLVTVDKNIRYQQNTDNLQISILVLSARTNNLTDLLPLIPSALEALASIGKGRIVSVAI